MAVQSGRLRIILKGDEGQESDNPTINETVPLSCRAGPFFVDIGIT